MKTTLELDDDLYANLSDAAAITGVSVPAYIEQSLRHKFAMANPQRLAMKLPSLKKSSQTFSAEQIYELVEN